MKTGFNNEKYLQMQSEHIRERIDKSGDMLCGIITGLAASQNPLEAALCGVWAHNQAPLCSKKDPAAFGPQDLVDALSDVWKSLREGRDL